MELTVGEVARLFGVSEETIFRWIEERALPAQQVNEQLRCNRALLLEWATAHGVQVTGELFTPGAAVALPTLGDALAAGGVLHAVGGRDKESVLRAVVAAMPLPESLDRDFLVRVLLAREALGSTGIGDGIAIPHPRTPIVAHVQQPTVTLCFLAEPIDFGAIDGQPVFALFTLVSATAKAHLHVLSRLAHVLRDAGCRAAVLRRARGEEILAEIRRVEAALASRSGQS